ncbi:M48 family metallopeptidase [Micromonospora siamensis]|uniref:M48 family metallopeptidase n=1 Tax=Micromonospora siamensis TaxID=299152 RepID=UPI000B5B06DF|nr:M48 family metallopeptidase [Micromonospora siamensis]
MTTTAATCPSCGTGTTALREAAPWCPGCEWNLDAYDPARRKREFAWGRLDRWAHRLAVGQFARLSARGLDDSGSPVARIVTMAVSVLLLAGVLALAATGVWLLVAFPFPNLSMLLGVVLLALAYALRPRFGRLDEHLTVLDRDRAPELFALVDEVAAAAGTPAPHVLAVDGTLNAYAGTVGVRRRRVLCLGLPLWGALPAGERVALLGHELGHFANGDPRRAPLVQPALTMLGSAADLVRPVGTVSGAGLLELVGLALAHAVQAVLARVLLASQLVLVAVALRDSQRAEYLADEMAARVAGTDAATGMLDALLAQESIALAVRRESRAGHGPDRWRAAVADARLAAADRLPLVRQLSVRDEVTLFAEHPPTGLRQRLLASRPRHEPLVVLTEQRRTRIDAELAAEYEKVRRAVSWAA